VLKPLIYKGFQLSQSFARDINTTVSTCNERGGLMSFTLSVVGNTSKALFALSVGGNMSTIINLSQTFVDEIRTFFQLAYKR
jgi:hypothetical protein